MLLMPAPPFRSRARGQAAAPAQEAETDLLLLAMVSALFAARLVAQEGPAGVMASSWRDPTDTTPTAARAPRQIHGYRTYCPLRRCRDNSSLYERVVAQSMVVTIRAAIDLKPIRGP